MSIKKLKRDTTMHGQNICVIRRRGEANCNEHWHDYYEMIYYYGCQGKCIVNGITRPITESCLLLMTPKDFHKTVNNPSEDCGSVLVQFSEHVTDMQLLELLNAGPIVLYDPSPTIIRYIDELEATIHKNSRFRDEHLSHLLNCLLINILEAGSCISATKHKNDPVIREAISYMLGNLQKNISLTDIAERYNLSPTYFSHLFHDCTGSAFKKYLTNLRIEYAKRMLEGSDTPIIDVGFECGFRTPSQFVRAFKSYTGEAPSVYRKKRQKRSDM